MMLPLLFSIVACETLGPSQAPLVQIENAHEFGSKRVAFSPSGKYLATSGLALGDFSKIKIWSVPELTLLQTFSKHRDTVRGIAWIDDNTIASGDEDGRIIVWKTSPPGLLKIKDFPSGITSLIHIPSKNLIVSGHRDGFVRAHASGTLDQESVFNMNARINSIAAAKGTNLIAVSSRDRRVVLLNLKLEHVRELQPPPRNAIEIAFSPDGRQVAGGAWFKLFFWDLSSQQLRVVNSDHWGAAFSIDYSPDGEYLASIGRHTDFEIYLVSSKTGKLKRHLRHHNLCGAAVRISPDGRYLATASDDRSIRLYDLSAPYDPR